MDDGGKGDKAAASIVVSLRLAPELATAFRTEAARRNIRLIALFAEMWANYRSQPSPPPRPRKPG